MKKSIKTIIAALALLPLPALAQGLPAGASSLSETYGDWQIACSVTENGPVCTLSQTQLSNDERRQRVLAVELRAADEAGIVNGLLVLPFGLDLESGVRFALDEQDLSSARFGTCMPAGCLVPLSFDAATVSQLSAGKVLAVKGAVYEGKQEALLSISLAGLQSALDRMAQINNN